MVKATRSHEDMNLDSVLRCDAVHAELFQASRFLTGLGIVGNLCFLLKANEIRYN